MKYKAIIFDLDGTLLDTLDDLGNATNRILSRYNYPVHEINQYRSLVGDGAKMLVQRALPEEARNEFTIDTCLKEFKEDYGQNWNVETTLYEGIAQLLDTAIKRGMKLAVLSNKLHEFTLLCAQQYLSPWPFSMILGQQEFIARKPNPEGALKIAEYMDIDPPEYLYLGDTAVDMQTAVAAGMFPVGVLWGFRSIDELRKNGARLLIEKPQELFYRL